MSDYIYYTKLLIPCFHIKQVSYFSWHYSDKVMRILLRTSQKTKVYKYVFHLTEALPKKKKWKSEGLVFVGWSMKGNEDQICIKMLESEHYRLLNFILKN